VKKELPRDVEIEKALLGALLSDPSRIPAVLEILAGPDDFYALKHQLIYKTIVRLFENGKEIDPVTVYSMLEKDGKVEEAGGGLYITKLCDAVVSPVMAEEYARIIRDKADRRRLYRVCAEGARMATTTDPDFETVVDVVSAIEKQLYDIARNSNRIEDVPLDKLVSSRWEAYVVEENETSFRGVRTGFIDLDNLIDGFQESEHIILAARPAMGKTSLALDICRNVARTGKRVLLFTMEMSRNRIADRFICAEALVSLKAFKRRELVASEKAKVNLALNRLAELPITVVDGQWNTAEIRSKIMREQKERGNLGLVVIDFLTKISEPRKGNISTHDLVGGVAQKLQNMAIELNVPLLTLAQLNRAVERRDNKRPVLSDLRESGNIEEACDKVLFIYRDEYYNNETKDKGVAEIIVAKNRDGPVGTVKLAWLPESATFRDLERRGETYEQSA